MSFWDKTIQPKVSCSLVVAHVHLGQTITNGHGLLFCLSCSCHFWINQFKQMSVALKCRLLLSIWVKPLEIDLGCSIPWDAHVYLGHTITNDYGLLFNVGCSCQFGSNHYKLIWVVLLYELLMSFWVLSIQTKLGCSLVLVAHVHLSQTIRNRLELLFCLSCSCHFGIKQFNQKSVAL